MDNRPAVCCVYLCAYRSVTLKKWVVRCFAHTCVWCAQGDFCFFTKLGKWWSYLRLYPILHTLYNCGEFPASMKFCHNAFESQSEGCWFAGTCVWKPKWGGFQFCQFRLDCRSMDFWRLDVFSQFSPLNFLSLGSVCVCVVGISTKSLWYAIPSGMIPSFPWGNSCMTFRTYVYKCNSCCITKVILVRVCVGILLTH